MINIHFYSDVELVDAENVKILCRDWDSTDFHFQYLRECLRAFGEDRTCCEIHTVEMAFLASAWDLHFEAGAHVFVHDSSGTFEIKEGDACDRTDRYLRRAHNAYKLWAEGEFSGRDMRKEGIFNEDSP